MGSCYSQWISLLKKALYCGLCLYSKFVCWSFNLPNHLQSPPPFMSVQDIYLNEEYV